MDAYRREALLAEYKEVSNNFRLLTEIRFKLLAFLPVATAVAAVLKGGLLDMRSGVISLFGLAVTIGLVTYNARNDQLYDELIGRAASIERSLGIPDGAFANRPMAWLKISFLGLKWTVNHGQGIRFIYAASIALWLFGLLAPILEYARNTYLSWGFTHFVVTDPTACVQILALALAVLFTLVTAKSIDHQSEVREEQMREDAASAVRRAVSKKLSEIENDHDLIPLCVKLLLGEEADRKGKARQKVLARAKFLATIDADSIGHYLPCGSPELAAAGLIAILTDLPPGWLFDCLSSRRVNVGDTPSERPSPSETSLGDE
jgi:hypothetical protein